MIYKFVTRIRRRFRLDHSIAAPWNAIFDSLQWFPTLLLVTVFIGWTVTSYLCHVCGKLFLLFSENHLHQWTGQGQENMLRLLLATLLTSAQSLACLLMVTPTHMKCLFLVRRIIIFHALATLATNYSMAYIEAASTFAIKLTEPVTMAIAHHIVHRTAPSWQTVVSVPLIIYGALLFSGENLTVLSDRFGVFLACASNIILTLRNINLKTLQMENSTGPVMALSPTRNIATFLLYQVLIVIALSLLEFKSPFFAQTWWLALLMFSSAIFHVSYSYISTNVVLKVMNIVSHSIANICKRLLVVLLLFVIGPRHASSTNGLGFLLAAVGLGLYLHGKIGTTKTKDPEQANRSNGLTLNMSRRNIVVAFGMIYCVFAITTYSLVGSNFTSHFKELYSKMADNRPNNYIARYLPFSVAKLDPTLRKVEEYDLIIPSPKDIASNFTGPDYSIPNPFPPMQDIKVRENNAGLKAFLKKRLINHPDQTDMRAKTLITNAEIVEESQRILLNLMTDLMGKTRHVMLIEMATYENKGDAAITVGQLMLLRRMNISIVFYCGTQTCRKNETVEKAKAIDKKYATDELIILFQGGGNLVGYDYSDNVRKIYIENFSHRKMIIFSQSVRFKEYNLKSRQQIYSNRSNLVMFLRDRQSLEIMKNNFKGTRHILAPDLALFMGLVPKKNPPKYDIVWLKRRDKESSKYTMPTFPPEISVHVDDWLRVTTLSMLEISRLTEMEIAFKIALAGFSFLEQGRVVVTDRLHGHILSTLLSIPHVLIDNPPFLKLSSFGKSWTESLNNTVRVNNGTLALQEALIMLKQYNSSLPALKHENNSSTPAVNH